MDREIMEVDLHSMHEAGLRKALFLAVNIGVFRMILNLGVRS